MTLHYYTQQKHSHLQEFILQHIIRLRYKFYCIIYSLAVCTGSTDYDILRKCYTVLYGRIDWPLSICMGTSFLHVIVHYFFLYFIQRDFCNVLTILYTEKNSYLQEFTFQHVIRLRYPF